MKITVNKGDSQSREWRGACRKCKSEATAMEFEMTMITQDCRDGGRFSWEKCPVCGAGPFGGMIFYPTPQ